MPSASSVGRPETLGDASDAVRDAAHAGRRIRIGENLVTDGLARILEHEPGDLTCIVEAGVRLSHLQAELARQGQRLALDPPGDPTIGACLAMNLSGPLRHRFGSPRDLVLGATLVLGDGTVANSGGRVVKNVAGYDLAKLMCGSRGSLALIVRVALRLHPVPVAGATQVVDSEHVTAAVADLLASQLQPSALDLLHPGRVAVLFEGSPKAVETQMAHTGQLVGGVPTDDAVWSESRQRQGAARGRVRFAPGDLATAITSLDAAIVRPAAGIAYVTQATAETRPEGVRRLESALKEQLDPLGTFAAAASEAAVC
jgi:glycolate oxidase FAD binding subunit